MSEKQLLKELAVELIKSEIENELLTLQAARKRKYQALGLSTQQVQFKLEVDHEVEDECDLYDDEIYDMDDPNKPDLPIHKNCKCYYEDVETGAYLGQFNANVYQASEEEEGRWVTLEGGQRLFIREGETIGEAFGRAKAYAEAHPKIYQKEKIEISKTPTQEHKRSADTVNKKYPSLSKAFLEEQAVEADKLRSQHKAVAENVVRDFKKEFSDASEVSGRLKDRTNMLDKLGRKPETYKDVRQLTDVSGVRVVSSKGVDDVEAKVRYIESKYTVIEKENYMHNDKGGYRSVHLLVKDKQSGLISEIQVRTQNQDKWANYAHDKIYKMPDDVLVKLDKNRGEVNAYTKAMSNYFYDLDTGKQGSIKPPCPDIVHEVLGCL